MLSIHFDIQSKNGSFDSFEKINSTFVYKPTYERKTFFIL